MKFQSIGEIKLREAFDPEAALTKENYAGAIGPTYFPDDAPARCQLLRVAKACGSEFQKGWLVSIQGGREVLLGGCCATAHFPLLQFRLDSQRINQELELADLLARLAASRSDAALRGSFIDLQSRFHSIERQVRSIGADLPGRVFLQLSRMTAMSIPTASYRIEYWDENDRGERFSRLERRQSPPIRGLLILSAQSLLPIRNALVAAERALEDDAPAGKIRDLRRRVAAIAGLESVPGQIAVIESALAVFDTSENFMLIALLASEEETRLGTVSAGLRRGGLPWKGEHAIRALEGLRSELSEAEGGRRVVFG